MLRLPISGVRTEWRASSGHDDIALADSGAGLAAALAFVHGRVVDADGSPVDAGALPVGDLDLLVVARRRDLIGDSLVAEGSCARCEAAVDVRFGLGAYVSHNRGRAPRNVTAAAEGWWELSRHAIRVRVPAVQDVLSAAAASDPRGELIARCLSGTLSPAAVRAGERAMESLGPTLRAEVAGTCPECGDTVVLDVDARELCLGELRFLASLVYDDVHAIATSYGWDQDAILDMPSARRRRYADLVRDSVSAPVSNGRLSTAESIIVPLEASVG
jgi:hypothetical protein